jgi:hypothetical protein
MVLKLIQMKKNPSYPIIFLLLICITGCNRINAQASFQDKQIKEMLRNFYTEYISEIAKPKTNWTKVDSIRVFFSTSSFIRDYTKLHIDFDPFLFAQLADLDMLKKLDFEKDSILINIYYVFYDYANKRIKIKLKIAKENGAYKIDNVFLKEYEEEKITK